MSANFKSMTNEQKLAATVYEHGEFEFKKESGQFGYFVNHMLPWAFGRIEELEQALNSIRCEAKAVE